MHLNIYLRFKHYGMRLLSFIIRHAGPFRLYKTSNKRGFQWLRTSFQGNVDNTAVLCLFRWAFSFTNKQGFSQSLTILAVFTFVFWNSAVWRIAEYRIAEYRTQAGCVCGDVRHAFDKTQPMGFTYNQDYVLFAELEYCINTSWNGFSITWISNHRRAEL